MKKYLGAATLIALASAANAADIPVKMPLKAPPPVVSYDWTGFYVGGYYGEAIGGTRAHSAAGIGTPFTFLGTAQVNHLGFAAGVTAGFNWQFVPHWLLGVEGDFGWLGVDRTEQDWDDTTKVGIKADRYGTARARFGYVTGPSLLYATGGAAFVHVRETFGGNFVANPATAAAATQFSTTRTGWTAGGGIETKLSRNWSAKTEYLYIDAGSNSFAAGVFQAVPNQLITFENRFHVIKTGVNYRFGGPGADEGILALFTGPALPSDHNWQGFYLGANVGVGISNTHGPGGEGAVPFGTETDQNATGFAGGGQVGFNAMLTPRWFAGVEGDFGALALKSALPEFNDFGRTFSEKTSWYGTARGRFGISTGPALLYLTAGAAWVRLKDGITILNFNNDVASKTASGWTAGGGTEVALDSRWSARVEALYMDVGHTPHAVGAVNANFQERFTVVRAGLNMKLGDIVGR